MLLRNSSKFFIPKLPTILHTRSYSTTNQIIQHLKRPAIAQSVKGPVDLITGNFAYFTQAEAKLIKKSLARGQTFVLVFDRDSIPVPANERAMWIREYFKHDANLEVRVAYGPPQEKHGTESKYHTYIQKQLPENITIKRVCGDQFFSFSLAEYLGAEYEFTDNQEVEKEKSLFPQRVISPFKETIPEENFLQLVASEKKNTITDLEILNPNHPNLKHFFNRTPWDLSALNGINLPVKIGQIANQQDRESFSNHTNTQVFDMPIYIPGQGWKIPTELLPYEKVIARIFATESLVNPNISDCYVYITTDAGVVHPNGFARRDGLHIDGFLIKANMRPDKSGYVWGDNTYIVSDAKELQTELYPGPFDLSKVDVDNPQAVLNAFEIQGRNMSFQQAEPYDIVKLTTNNVHAVHPNLSSQYLLRSFLKITFSERLFNRSGNTVNPNFNYRFLYVPRSEGRNVQNYIGNTPLGFKEVDLREMNFETLQFPDWVKSQSFYACKRPDISINARPAIEGEYLETVVDGNLVTQNVAKEGDMKVSRTDSDCYFLGKNFFTLYKKNENNSYNPIPRQLQTVTVQQPVSFLAPWGTRQNIPAGGFIVHDQQNNETWGVHEESFKATYQTLKYERS